jgi:hypothetical protein
MSLLRRLFGATTIELPNREYDALIAAALRMSYDLESLLKKAKCVGRIEATDVEQLVSNLNFVCGQSKERYETRLKENSKDTRTTKWDAEGHALYVKPAALFISAPETIIKAAVEAAEKGIREPDVIYKYILSELEAALQRWQVSLKAAVRTANPST